MQNFILIGMPGSGKSTLGKTLADTLSYHFIDTDEVIMETYQKSLMELIQEHHNSGFIQLEGQVLQSIHTNHAIISTGGSAIYHEGAMQYLKQNGTVVYLYHGITDLIQRVGDMVERGVVCHGGCSTLQELYAERCPYYEKYADITVDLTKCSLRECNERLFHAVQPYVQETETL